MSNLTDYAKSELEKAGWFDKDGIYGGMMGDAVLKMIDIFSQEGHSGASAGIATKLFAKVAAFEPLTPLTGDDSEWNEVSTGIFQNKRCSHVFKENGRAYDITGKIFREKSGVCFTNRDSRVDVIFPYTPSSEIVDVEDE